MKIKYFIKNPKNIILGVLYKYGCFIPDKLYITILYRLRLGKLPNLKRPASIQEKIQWLKLYDRKPEYTTMVDKYAVKDYVAKKIGKEYIIPILGVWDNANKIEWDLLPNVFVLKTTHGGGGTDIIIVDKKNGFNKKNVINKLNKALKKNTFARTREWPYKNVPKKIIAEKFITNGIDKDLPDYKWYCFNGVPKFCQVIRNRHTIETIDFYDTEWNHQKFLGLTANVHNGKKPVPKPITLEEQINIAKKLSENIPFVRVDLYVVNDVIYFGELTFYPASGLGRFRPEEYNYYIGNLLSLNINNDVN